VTTASVHYITFSSVLTSMKMVYSIFKCKSL